MNSQPPQPTEIVEVNPAIKGEETEGFERVQNYLSRFGYLEEGSYEPGKLDDTTSEALTKFQALSALPRSGNFDETTLAAMTTPSCGMPDLAPSIKLGVEFSTTCNWDQTEITFAFDTGSDDVAGDSEFQAVRNAFQTWEDALPLTFTEVTQDQDPNVIIDWRPANDPDLNMVGSTLAHADFPPGCSVVTDTLPLPLHFDDTEHNWSIGAVSGSFDIETVALHEIGHILGLAHSEVTSAVMFRSVSSNVTKRTLTQDDLLGAEQLYPGIARRGDSDDLAGFVGGIAAIRHLTRQVVTAVRTAEATLKLISWRVNDDGSVSRTGDSSNQAGVASSIDIARGSRYVTACRTAEGNLKLISWNIDAAGAITRAGDSGNQAGTANLIKVVAVSNTLFATACRTAEGNLKLISWRLNSDGSITRLKDSGNAAGAIGDVSLIALAGGATGGRVVTSVRDGSSNLKLIVWNVSADGTFSRRGDSGGQAGGASLIRSIRDSFGNVVTSVRTSGGDLKLIAWRVSSDGQTVSRLGDSDNLAGAIGGNALMSRPDGRAVSAVRTAEGTLKLISWKLSAGAGAITRLTSSGDQAGTASLITLCQEALSGGAPVLTAVRTAEGNLKLITWSDQ